MSAHDWPEDLEHENGNYTCGCISCGAIFIGLKRRVICKKCAFRPESDLPLEGLIAALAMPPQTTMAQALEEVRRLRAIDSAKLELHRGTLVGGDASECEVSLTMPRSFFDRGLCRINTDIGLLFIAPLSQSLGLGTDALLPGRDD